MRATLHIIIALRLEEEHEDRVGHRALADAAGRDLGIDLLDDARERDRVARRRRVDQVVDDLHLTRREVTVQVRPSE